MSRDIIIIGGSDQQLPLVQKAKELKYRTHVFDLNPKCECSEVADYFYPISIYDPIKILKVAYKIEPVSILSIATEVGNKTATFLANKLKLITNSYTTACITTDKIRMKRHLLKHKVPTPKYYVLRTLNQLESLDLQFPLIVKASDRTGGRGIQKVLSPDKIRPAFEQARETAFNNSVIIEEFFEGNQYSVETISSNGIHQIVGVTEQFYTGDPHFVECQDLLQARLDKNQLQQIEKIVKETLNALSVKFGASHIELRINSNQEVKIIEVASRMGGGFRHELIELSNGNDFIKMLIDVSLGKDINMLPPQRNNLSILKWICKNEDFTTFKNIKEQYPEMIVRENIKYTEEPFTAKNGTERKGYYILNLENKDENRHLIDLFLKKDL